VLLVLLLLVTGCAESEGTESVGNPTQLLAAVPQAARDAGTVRYESVSESALDDEPLQVSARMSGALDVAADAGTADLELVGLDELAADGQAEDPAAAADLADLARTRLSWTAADVTVELGGERTTVPRDDAESGVFARVPGEPTGLLRVVAAASDVEVGSDEELDGVPTAHLRATVQPQAAVEAGLGTQAQLSMAQLPSLPVEVWLDDAGLPLRIRYTVELPSMQEGRQRTVVTTYDYRGWGEPVDLAP
jgi:hypothetical protein